MNIALIMSEVAVLCRQAGDAIMKIYADKESWHVQQKADASPVTEADLEANQILIEGLSQLTPDIPVLSEEGREIPWEHRSEWHRYWLIDPLDGTKEFIAGNDEFTVNVALIENGEAILGVVVAPAMGLTFKGALGLGAFKREGLGETQAIHCRPLNKDVRLLASRRHGLDKLNNLKEKLQQEFDTVTQDNLGSSLKICEIAQGQADIYARFGPTCEWDTAAGHAVLTAAGGHLIDHQGQPLVYNQKESLLNPEFFAFGAAELRWKSLICDEILALDNDC